MARHLCKTCYWWAKSPELNLPIMGECASPLIHFSQYHAPPPDIESHGLYAADFVATGPEFGCVNWKQKEQSESVNSKT